MKISVVFLLVLFLFFTIGGTEAFSENSVYGEKESYITGDEFVLSKGNMSFSLDLYQKLRKKEGNIFFSPYSISTALGMIYAGSRANTAIQMKEVLHFSLDNNKLHNAFRNLLKALKEGQRKGKVELNIANALWVQKGLTLEDDFLSLIKKDYDGELVTVDFVNSVKRAEEIINSWVEKKTRGKIKKLFEKGVLSRATVSVLVNAIYFKGMWATPFKKSLTRKEFFKLSAEDKVRVSMMHRTGEFGFLDEKTFRVLELPYFGEKLTMVIFLPKHPSGLLELEKSLTLKRVLKCFNSLKRRDIKLYLPRFKTSSSFRLNEVLKSMGIIDLFSKRKANLSGMFNLDKMKSSVWVEVVLHKAFIDVNEEGTEAAAITGISVESVTSVGMPPIEFRVDSPFVFMIRDKDTKSILFMGRVKDPRS